MAKGNPASQRGGGGIDPLVAIGLIALAMQAVVMAAPAPVATAIDPVAPGMVLLALLCCWRTWTAAPPIAMAGRWRWRAAMAGWLLWALQWTVNMIEPPWLPRDERLLILPIVAHRVAFIVALVPIASAHDGRLFRWLDMVLGIIFASLLTLLSWPDVVNEPDRRFLYLGYSAMAALAAVSMVAQRTGVIRPLPRALFATLLLYGLHGIVMRELFVAGVIDNHSPVFLLGDLAFLAYLVLMPARPVNDAVGTEPPDAVVLGRLVPLVLTGLIIVLAFAVSDTRPATGIAVALAAFATYAARTTLTEHLHHAAQRMRLATMVDMMHEIRSPLAVVALNVGLLTRRAPADERERRIRAAIETGCSNVVILLEDVLSLERLEAGLVPPVIACHDVVAIVQETVTLLEARWRAAGVVVQYPETPVFAMVDRMALHRILMNLIGNAVRFTPADGEVRITVARPGDGAVTLIVHDTGVGMAEDVRARLFQRFAVVGQPLHGPRGTGLGLSISLALARTMGGGIEITSRENVGTAAKVVIPQTFVAN